MEYKIINAIGLTQNLILERINFNEVKFEMFKIVKLKIS